MKQNAHYAILIVLAIHSCTNPYLKEFKKIEKGFLSEQRNSFSKDELSVYRYLEMKAHQDRINLTFNYVDSLKSEYAALAEKEKIQYGDKAFATAYLYSSGRALSIKNELAELNQYVGAQCSKTELDSIRNHLLFIEDVIDANGNQVTWEEHQFNDVPYIATISILSALQSDIRSLELALLKEKTKDLNLED